MTSLSMATEAVPADARSTRERILDAAEDTFAHRGYFAATIRDITQAADAKLSLSRYYFGSKDELFRQVVTRRADAICTMLETSLARAQARAHAMGDGGACLRAVVEAMVDPAVTRLASGDPGWRNYLQLLSSLGQLSERPDLLAPWRLRYVSTAAQFHAALAAAMPGVSDSIVGWGLHFLQSLLGHALLDVGVTRHVAGLSEVPVSWEELREQLVRHVVGGLLAQAGPAVDHRS